jgi:predicted nucleotidyltransferase
VITLDSIRARRADILEIAKRHGARNVRVFGSVARGDAIETSDVDFLVQLDPERTLLDQGGLLMDLTSLFGMKVDVIEDGQLSGRFGRIVTAEAVPL